MIYRIFQMKIAPNVNSTLTKLKQKADTQHNSPAELKYYLSYKLYPGKNRGQVFFSLR